MSDTKAWIDERRKERRAGWNDDEEEFENWSDLENATGAAYQHLPTALDALQAVLELHKRIPNSASAMYPDALCTCGADYPCETVRALEGVIDGD